MSADLVSLDAVRERALELRGSALLKIGSVPLPPARECFRSCNGADRPRHHRRR